MTAIMGVGALLLVAACGSAGQRLPDESAAALRWTGTFQPTKQHAGVGRHTARHAVHGRVRLTPSAVDTERTHVALTLTTPGHSASTLRWAVVPGSCGGSALPLLAYDQFPLLDVGSASNTQLEIVLPLRLEPGSAYHVNVYIVEGTPEQRHRLLTQPQLVVSCANVRA